MVFQKGNQVAKGNKPNKTSFKKGQISPNKGKHPYWMIGKNNPNWGKDMSGSNAPNWKGGITHQNRLAKRRIEYRLWREAVFARDNWICQKCNKRSGKGLKLYLHPHHIRNFSEELDLRFAIDNGITFCKKCHRKFHNKYGFRNNNQEQIDEFLIRELITMRK